MNDFPRLNLPLFDIALRPDADSRRGGMEVYDVLRRKWVALTPEEWVRQHFVNFLLLQRNFPASFMANEVGLKLNNTQRRVDTIVYTKTLKPLVVIEYKAPEIAITQAVFDQAVRYNSVFGASYLIVSNGMRHFCCRYTPPGYTFLRDIPGYTEL